MPDVIKQLADWLNAAEVDIASSAVVIFSNNKAVFDHKLSTRLKDFNFVFEYSGVICVSNKLRKLYVMTASQWIKYCGSYVVVSMIISSRAATSIIAEQSSHAYEMLLKARDNAKVFST
jgi:hypothetical protein